MDDTREVCTKRSFNRQTDAKAGTDQAFDAFPANIMSTAGILTNIQVITNMLDSPTERTFHMFDCQCDNRTRILEKA